MQAHQIIFLWCSLWIISFGSLMGQSNLVLSGYVHEAEGGEVLTGVAVQVPALRKGVYTNEYGFYSLSLPAGEHTLFVRYHGFAERQYQVSLIEDSILSFTLEPLSQQIDTVAITAYKRPPGLSVVEISREDIQSIPTLMGEADLLKVAQLLPGVQGGAEGTSSFFVRGGSGDQNLVLLDGVPVYHIAHLFGLFSVFNPDAIQKADLIKGGFSARYGGRLSSVMDISLKEGNRKERHGSASIGLISSRIMLEGPIGKKGRDEAKTSYLISARRTYLDLLAGIAQRIANPTQNTTYNFYDLTAKVNHRFSERDQLYFSIYNGRDRFSNRTENSLQEGDIEYNTLGQESLIWGNTTALLRWNHLQGRRLFSHLSLSLSDYQLGVERSITAETIPADPAEATVFINQSLVRSAIRDWALRMDFSYQIAARHLLRFGAGTIFHQFRPNIREIRVEAPQAPSIEQNRGQEALPSFEHFAYLEDEWRIGERMKLQGGLRYTIFQTKNEQYAALLPRLSIEADLSETIRLNFAYNQNFQALHRLSSTNVSLPVDLWVPASEGAPPQRAWQVSMGLSGNLGQQYQWGIEGFYKEMDNVVEYLEGANFLSSGPDPDELDLGEQSDWESQLAQGRGWAYGGEFLLRKTAGKLKGWLSYTLSWSWRQFPDLNQGESFPFRYDRRHFLNLTLSYPIKPKMRLQANWTYQTGIPITIPLAEFETHPASWLSSSTETSQFFSGRNAYRLPDYHRLDLGLILERPRNGHQWQFSLYNAYNRLNPFVTWINTNGTIDQLTAFPIIPSVAYQFTF
ncbi:MAG: TonB-dependent receptor [Bacteroidia bacterium]